MNLVELMLSVSLLAIVVASITHAVPVLQKNIDTTRLLREEITQVEQVIQTVTRSIRQAGFTNLLQINDPTIHQKKPPFPGLQIFNQSILATANSSQFAIPQTYSASSQPTDALLIRHAVLGHADCLGRKITKNRTQQGLARIGFFVQFRKVKNKYTGYLMCQSLNQQGHPQNDSILSGIDGFAVTLEERVVRMTLTMDSKRQYTAVIALQNEPL